MVVEVCKNDILAIVFNLDSEVFDVIPITS